MGFCKRFRKLISINTHYLLLYIAIMFTETRIKAPIISNKLGVSLKKNILSKKTQTNLKNDDETIVVVVSLTLNA